MYFITKTQWNKIPEDFKTDKSITHGARACFETCINPKAEQRPVLIFEHLHFEVIPEDITTGESSKDETTAGILTQLSEMTLEAREDWRRECLSCFRNDPAAYRFVTLAVDYINNLPALYRN